MLVVAVPGSGRLARVTTMQRWSYLFADCPGLPSSQAR